MHPHLYFIPLIILVGAVFLFIMFRRNRRAGTRSHSEATDPRHLKRDDDPARRRALSEGPDS